jgi:uncharacterized membrane protein YpjA
VNHLYLVLSNKKFLQLLWFVNLLGTIYGYIWYIPQMKITKWWFLPFVPDSPTASLFFVIVLTGFWLKKNWGLPAALAMMTLFKYGIWAVVMNLLTLTVSGSLPWQGYMLMISHLAMAIEGILYAPFYRIKPWHFAVAAVWTLHNEMIDYVFMQYPIYPQLYLYIRPIGYFTFWLSICSIGITYFFGLRKKRLTFAFPWHNGQE